VLAAEHTQHHDHREQEEVGLVEGVGGAAGDHVAHVVEGAQDDPRANVRVVVEVLDADALPRAPALGLMVEVAGHGVGHG